MPNWEKSLISHKPSYSQKYGLLLFFFRSGQACSACYSKHIYCNNTGPSHHPVDFYMAAPSPCTSKCQCLEVFIEQTLQGHRVGYSAHSPPSTSLHLVGASQHSGRGVCRAEMALQAGQKQENRLQVSPLLSPTSPVTKYSSSVPLFLQLQVGVNKSLLTSGVVETI